ncbi:hypothetical protein Tco_0480366, partial [Tanacetum coccineum]
IEPFFQKRRVLAPDRSLAVIKEVEEFLNAGIVRPVKYPTWISNPVLVKDTIKSIWPKMTKRRLPFIPIKLGRNLEAYVEDMVIKSSDKKILLADIAKTFDNLRKINMMLNPKKCSFGIENGKLLCYMVTSEGIRDNLEKTKALTDMQSPRTLREMWSLSGKLAALNRFLAWSIEKTRKEKIDYKKAN